MTKKRQSADKKATDPFYAAHLCLRSLPVPTFLGGAPPVWELPITSIKEDRLLHELGLSLAERNQIEGLHVGRSSSTSASGLGLSESQLSALAIVRLAANPPPETGQLQRKSAGWLLRVFPHG